MVVQPRKVMADPDAKQMGALYEQTDVLNTICLC